MRKIEREMIEAILNGKAYHNNNTSVSCSEDTTKIYLHGHLIVKVDGKDLWVSDCNYQTKTTKSRLNCILSHFNLPTISAKKFEWYIGSDEWKGSKTFSSVETITSSAMRYPSTIIWSKDKEKESIN